MDMIASSLKEGCCTTKYAIMLVIVLGLFSAFKLCMLLLNIVWMQIRPSKVRSYGKWAVVTGATDGIGLAYAKQLAKNGLNIVLISRTRSRLESAAAEIKSACPTVEVRIIQADFNSTDEAALYEHIGNELKDITVGILINNVGRSYPHAEYLDLLDNETVDSIIRMNVNSTTKMTQLVLPGMLKAKKGAIINVSSAAGVVHTGDPLYTIYSATKSYVDFFSRSLHTEYAHKGIHVQCQVPYFVTTKLAKIRRSSLTVPTPNQYAKAALRHIGYGVTVVPYWAHAVQHYVFENVLPTFLAKKVLMGHHLSIRKRAYKKKEQAKTD